jgi:hypothetical protein
MVHALYGSITQNLMFLNKFWIILICRGLFQVTNHQKHVFFFKSKVFWLNEAVEVIEATEVVEAVEVIEVI